MIKRRMLKYLLLGACLLTIVVLYGLTQNLNRVSLESKHFRSRIPYISIRYDRTSLPQESQQIKHKEYFRNITSLYRKANAQKHKQISLRNKTRVEFPGMPDPCPNGKHRNTVVEDILCMKMPPILPNFKNPCWYKDGRLRCLPYFHIIGVPKSATTDLYSRLIKHPYVVENKGLKNKETWFWSWRRYRHMNRTYYGFINQQHSSIIDSILKILDFDVNKYTNESRLMTFKEYVSTFNVEEIGNNHIDGYHKFITGHGDPMDFTDFHWNYNIPQNEPAAEELLWTTPYLIKHVNPGVKLILILRDPVERLYSYYFFRKMGNTSTQFHNHVKESIQIWSDCIKFYSHRHCLYDVDTRKRMKVAIYSSFYSSHLKEWLKVFPREQMLILRTEDYKTAKGKTLQTVFDFLNLSPLSNESMDKIIQLPRTFVTEKKALAGAMLPKTRELLVNVYRKSTVELAELLRDERFAFKDESFVQSYRTKVFTEDTFPNSRHNDMVYPSGLKSYLNRVRVNKTKSAFVNSKRVRL